MKNAKGFAGIELLLILATLLAVGGVGGYLYTKRNKPVTTPVSKTSGPAAAGQSTSPGGIPGGVTAAPAASSSVGSSASNLNIIKIADPGFQISVPDSLKDLTYHNNSGTVSFSTTSLASLVHDCAANVNTGAFVTITRGNGTYQPLPNPADGGLLKQYGSYYLSYTLRTGPCVQKLSTKAQALLDDQSQTFYSALSTVTQL